MTTPPRGSRASSLDRIRDHPSGAGLFLDFDGTLSEIVERPEQAGPLPEVPSLLERLAGRYSLVAVVSGRPTDEVRRLVPARGVDAFGLYGLEALRPEGSVVPPEAREEVEAIAAEVAGALVEEKGRSVAVHFRQAPDAVRAGRRLAADLAKVADGHGLVLLPGKMVLELAPAAIPGKGEVVLHVARERSLSACLYAGDDVADLQAFEALDALAGDGVATAKVAVRSVESPPPLVTSADVVVDGPYGLVALLETLLPA